MLIARATKDDQGQALILGLSRGNVERLVAGQPIRLTPQTHGGIPEGWSILILYGETEQAIADDLRAAGAITPATKQVIDPRLG